MTDDAESKPHRAAHAGTVLPPDHEHPHRPLSRRAREQLALLFYQRMMLVLLALLVVMIFIVPVVTQDQFLGRLAVDIMLTLVLIVGTLAVSRSRTALWLLGSFSALALVLRWSEWVVPLGLLPLVRDVSVMIALVVMATAVAMNVFVAQGDVLNRLIGAIVLYLLIATFWSLAYLMLSLEHPHSFSVPSPEDVPLMQWLYFSFSTLTTVGYGDITPVSRGARSLAMVEALLGQLYPAIILAKLVSAEMPDSKS